MPTKNNVSRYASKGSSLCSYSENARVSSRLGLNGSRDKFVGSRVVYSSAVKRVARGGASHDSPDLVRVAARVGYPPDFWDYGIGFRVVVSPPSLDDETMINVEIPIKDTTPKKVFDFLLSLRNIADRDLEKLEALKRIALAKRKAIDDTMRIIKDIYE